MATNANVLKSDPAKPPIDTIGAKKNACPWCAWKNDDEMKGDIKKATDSVVRNVGHKWQCETCGKHWDLNQLGKPYSLELERGINWVREKQAREIMER